MGLKLSKSSHPSEKSQSLFSASKKTEFPGRFASYKNAKGPLQGYQIIRSLGTGMIGEVFEVEDAQGTRRAMKTINLKRYANRKKQQEELLDEITALKALDHPCVIRIYDSSLDQNSMTLVMDLCEGDTLSVGMQSRLQTEESVRKVVFQLCLALNYIHSRSLAHRDLKADNVMFISPNINDLRIVLVDFGTAAEFRKQPFSHMHGTPYYMSPQVVEKKYGLECDLWSLGVLTFFLLTKGKYPFDAPTTSRMFALIRTREPDLSPLKGFALDLVHHLLIKNVTTRWTAKQALECEWFRDLLLQEEEGEVHEKHVVDSITNYIDRSKFEKITRMVVTHQTSGRQAQSLRNAFLEADADNSGILDAEELKTLLLRNGVLEENIEAFFANLDVDASGGVQFTELVAGALDSTCKIDRTSFMNAFDYMGLGTEFITAEHLKSMLGAEDSTRVHTILHEVDANGDGKISKEEFLRAVESSN